MRFKKYLIIYVFKIDCVNKSRNKNKKKKKLDWRLKYCLYITLRKKKMKTGTLVH